MSERPIDLARIRAALRRLDDVVRDHPELTAPEAQERLMRAECIASGIDRVTMPDLETEEEPAGKPEDVRTNEEEAEPAGDTTPNGLLSRNPSTEEHDL